MSTRIKVVIRLEVPSTEKSAELLLSMLDSVKTKLLYSMANGDVEIQDFKQGTGRASVALTEYSRRIHTGNPGH